MFIQPDTCREHTSNLGVKNIAPPSETVMLSGFLECPAIILRTKEEIEAFELLLLCSSMYAYFRAWVPDNTEKAIVKFRKLTVENLLTMATIAEGLSKSSQVKSGVLWANLAKKILDVSEVVKIHRQF
jgi:hypothetical protein